MKILLCWKEEEASSHKRSHESALILKTNLADSGSKYWCKEKMSASLTPSMLLQQQEVRLQQAEAKWRWQFGRFLSQHNYSSERAWSDLALWGWEK